MNTAKCSKSTGLIISRYLLLPCTLFFMQLVCATPLKTSMKISLEAKDGTRMQIGQLQLTPDETGYKISVELDDSKFEDKFLSMRPFNCLPHPQQVVCHLAYPYESRHHITKNDLSDLEYDLLFLHKTPEEYGIDAWNGFYYEMKMTENGFEGELRETDLNVLAAPPKDGNLRPIKRSELHEASEKHWPRRIIIE